MERLSRLLLFLSFLVSPVEVIGNGCCVCDNFGLPEAARPQVIPDRCLNNQLSECFACTAAAWKWYVEGGSCESSCGGHWPIPTPTLTPTVTPTP